MRRISIQALVAAIAWVFSSAPAGAERPPATPGDDTGLPTIGVVRIAAPEMDEWWLSRGDAEARDVFVRALLDSGRFEVVERAEFDRRAQAEGLLSMGELSPAEAVKVGRVMGLDYVIGAAVHQYEAVVPGLVARGVGKLPGVGIDRHLFVAELGVRLWETTRGRALWAESESNVLEIPRDRALAIRDGDPEPETTFRQSLLPMLERFAARIAVEPSIESAGPADER